MQFTPFKMFRSRKKISRVIADTDTPLPHDELMRWIQTAKSILWKPEYRETLEARGISLTPARFYNEIPTVKELKEGFENTDAVPYQLPFLDREQMAETLGKLSSFNSEFSPPLEASTGFYWKNPAFSFSDAMSYYCFVRMRAPKTVLEVGSGFSTMVAMEAAARNGDTKVICIEPYPKDFLRKLDVQIHEKIVQDCSAEFFNDILSDGDILFIDSTHAVKASSDCCHLYLRVLPNIRRKLIVHVHDVYLPKGIAVKTAIEKHIYWTEQYLLAAYMLDNPKVRFLYGSAFAYLVARPELTEFMQGKYSPGGGSFWFELDGRFP